MPSPFSHFFRSAIDPVFSARCGIGVLGNVARQNPFTTFVSAAMRSTIMDEDEKIALRASAIFPMCALGWYCLLASRS